MQKVIKSELSSFQWPGGQSLVVRQLVIEGPTAFLDRRVHLTLSFDEVRQAMDHVLAAEKRLAESQAKVDAVNTANQE